MITFLPSWKGVAESSTDDLIGQIQALQSAKRPCRIILTDYLPQLRYFLHRFDLLETDHLNLFDQLQGFSSSTEQQVVPLEALNFPKQAAFTYSPFALLVHLNGEWIGQVFFGEGGQLSEVHHRRFNRLQKIEIYDDRGFRSSVQVFENEQLQYTSYLDHEGTEIFHQFSHRKDCLVNPKNRRGLKKDYYETLEELIFERLETHFLNEPPEGLIVSVTEARLPYLVQSPHAAQMVLSLFGNRCPYTPSTEQHIKQLAQQVKGFIVDRQTHFDQLEAWLGSPQLIHHLPPYDTRFQLSISQELHEEILYLEGRNVSDELLLNSLSVILAYWFEVLSLEENERCFQCLVRLQAPRIKALTQRLEELLKEAFPDEMTLIETGIFEEEGENETLALSTIPKEALEAAQLVYQLKSGIEFSVLDADVERFKALHESRLVIDLSPEPDLSTQLAAISAGLPQINAFMSPYVTDRENGWLLSPQASLAQALSYYLDTLKHWQEARLSAIQRIKNYAGPILSKRLLALFERKNND